MGSTHILHDEGPHGINALSVAELRQELVGKLERSGRNRLQQFLSSEQRIIDSIGVDTQAYADLIHDTWVESVVGLPPVKDRRAKGSGQTRKAGSHSSDRHK